MELLNISIVPAWPGTYEVAMSCGSITDEIIGPIPAWRIETSRNEDGDIVSKCIPVSLHDNNEIYNTPHAVQHPDKRITIYPYGFSEEPNL